MVRGDSQRIQLEGVRLRAEGRTFYWGLPWPRQGGSLLECMAVRAIAKWQINEEMQAWEYPETRWSKVSEKQILDLEW